jgi:tetratricopeptide (TPR) repeat protein
MESVDLDILQHVLQAVGESFEQGQDASAAASAFARAAEMAQALARIDGAAAEAAAATKAALDAAAASRAERQAQSTQTQQQRAARVQQQHEQHSRGESTTRTSVQRVEKEKEKDKVAVRRTSPSEEEAKLLYKQGSALYAAGEYARAAVVLQQVMNLMPKHAGAAGNLAACHFQCVYLFSDALPPLCPRKMHVYPPHWLTFSVLYFFIFPPLLSLLFSFSLRFFVSHTHTHTHTHSLSLSKGSATWRPQSK